MRFTKEIIEQIGTNVIVAVADPVVIDGFYQVSKNEFDKIADSIAYAIGNDYVLGLEYHSQTLKKYVDVVIFDNNGKCKQVTYWAFKII